MVRIEGEQIAPGMLVVMEALNEAQSGETAHGVPEVGIGDEPSFREVVDGHRLPGGNFYEGFRDRRAPEEERGIAGPVGFLDGPSSSRVWLTIVYS